MHGCKKRTFSGKSIFPFNSAGVISIGMMEIACTHPVSTYGVMQYMIYAVPLTGQTCTPAKVAARNEQKSVIRVVCIGSELMGRICRSKETGLLISPSYFCLPGNNHSLPSNILSIRQNRSSRYTTADRSHTVESTGAWTESAFSIPLLISAPSEIQSPALIETDACNAMCYTRYVKRCREDT